MVFNCSIITDVEQHFYSSLNYCIFMSIRDTLNGIRQQFSEVNNEIEDEESKISQSENDLSRNDTSNILEEMGIEVKELEDIESKLNQIETEIENVLEFLESDEEKIESELSGLEDFYSKFDWEGFENFLGILDNTIRSSEYGKSDMVKVTKPQAEYVRESENLSAPAEENIEMGVINPPPRQKLAELEMWMGRINELKEAILEESDLVDEEVNVSATLAELTEDLEQLFAETGELARIENEIEKEEKAVEDSIGGTGGLQAEEEETKKAKQRLKRVFEKRNALLKRIESIESENEQVIQENDTTVDLVWDHCRGILKKLTYDDIPLSEQYKRTSEKNKRDGPLQKKIGARLESMENIFRELVEVLGNQRKEIEEQGGRNTDKTDGMLSELEDKL